jgi:hypothetical protein
VPILEHLAGFKRHLTGFVSLAKKDMLPLTLYHYTTAGGFEGIFRTFTIRATNLAYMHDPSELEYGKQIVKRTLDQEIKVATGLARLLLTEASLALDKSAVSEVYVACFTLLKDNLGQWRSYGGSGGERYAIGFNPGVLQDATFSLQDAQLTKVSYAASVQAQRIRTVLRRAIEFVSREKVVKRKIRPYAVETARRLAQLIPALKTREYSIEKEWRIVIIRPASLVADIEFDTSHGVVRPYVPFTVRTPDDHGIMSVHVLAPTRPAAAIKAANLVLRHAQVKTIVAKQSRVPFAE